MITCPCSRAKLCSSVYFFQFTSIPSQKDASVFVRCSVVSLSELCRVMSVVICLFALANDADFSMIHLNCLPVLAFMSDTSALMPHQYHVM